MEAEQNFSLERYLNRGVEKIIQDALRATLQNPKGSIYLSSFAIAAGKASKKRVKSERDGKHIPPFLIASITSKCNLYCTGCYARANQSCNDKNDPEQMSGEQWEAVFSQAVSMGISFILLAGGEPTIRMDVLKRAGKYPQILFPVFTNGTQFNEEKMNIFSLHRNLVPILSIEGDKEETDRRRGEGVYRQLEETMEKLSKEGLLFGCSITVTKENLEMVTERSYLEQLKKKGCKATIFVEYVPVSEKTADLAPGDEERKIFESRLNELRNTGLDMVLIAFPGDEKSSGGCLAAGRGFFHISSNGQAEPCPFSPYSDCNVKEKTLEEVLKSRLFRNLKSNEILMAEHKGGCVLFEKKEQVEKLLS